MHIQHIDSTSGHKINIYGALLPPFYNTKVDIEHPTVDFYFTGI